MVRRRVSGRRTLVIPAVAFLVVGQGIALAGPVVAQDTRAVVLPFEGRYAARLRQEVVSALSEHVDLVPQDTFRAAAGGATGASGYARAAGETGVSAIVSGETRRRGRNTETTITLRGADGDVIQEVSVAHRNPRQLARQLRNGLWNELGNAILDAPRPPSRAEERPTTAADQRRSREDAESEEAAGRTGPRPSPFQLFTGLRIFNRNFDYSDDVTATPVGAPDGLRVYEMPAASAVELDAVFYPAALWTDGILADIGIEAGFYYALFLNSQECRQRNATTQACERTVDFPTSASGLQLGARMRFRFDSHEVYGRLGYQSMTFRIEALDVDNPAPQVPDVGYDMLRIGAGARFVFAPVVLEPRAGILLVVGSGQLSEDVWFPDSSAFAFEAGLRVGLQVLDWLEVVAAFDFSQVGISLNDGPGSATDRYISGTLGAQLRVPEDR